MRATYSGLLVADFQTQIIFKSRQDVQMGSISGRSCGMYDYEYEGAALALDKISGQLLDVQIMHIASPWFCCNIVCACTPPPINKFMQMNQL